LIKVIRIDDRLIHRQVVEGWVKYFGLNKIVVIDEEVFNDEFQKKIMRMSLPDEIKLEFSDFNFLKDKWKRWNEEDDKIIVLLSKVSSVLKLVEAGIDLKEINVGCIHYEEGKYCVWKSIYWNEEEKKIFNDLKDRGIRIEGKGIPQEIGVDIVKLLRRQNGE